MHDVDRRMLILGFLSLRAELAIFSSYCFLLVVTGWALMIHTLHVSKMSSGNWLCKRVLRYKLSPFGFLFLALFVCLFVYLFVCLFVCVCVCVCVFQLPAMMSHSCARLHHGRAKFNCNLSHIFAQYLRRVRALLFLLVFIFFCARR
jgi:hypothetical protein